MSKEGITKLIRSKRDANKQVFICGNGGSASTAEHFANDLFSKGVKAICLSSNVSILTMIANDFGYEYIFSKQLEVYANPGDLVVLISCSGISKNIVKVANMPIERVEIFGGNGSYGEMESYHLFLLHRIAEEI